MMVFTRIISLKRGYGMVFMCIVTIKIIFSMKSDYSALQNLKESKQKNVSDYPITHYWCLLFMYLEIMLIFFEA